MLTTDDRGPTSDDRQLPSPPPGSSSIARRLWPVLGLFLIALAVRLNCLDCFGLWYDEVSSIEAAQRGLEAIFRDRFGWVGNQTPLHYFIVWLTTLPVDPSTTAVLVRLPSVLAGAATPVVVYALGSEMFGRVQGLFAALLTALSSWHIGFSQDVRPYTTLTLLTTLSVYSLLIAERTHSRAWWAAFAASTAASLLITNVAFSVMLPALLPYLLWVLFRLWSRRTHRSTAFRPALISLLVIGMAAVPAFLSVQGVARSAPDLTLLPTTVLDQGVRLINSFVRMGIGDLEPVVEWLLVVFAAVGVVAALLARRIRLVLLCLSMILIPALILAVLRTGGTVFQRYALFAMPFYFLLAGNGLASIGAALPSVGLSMRRVAQVLAGAAGGLILAAFAWSVYIYFSPEGHKQLVFYPDYRGAARYLSEHAGPQDTIILYDEPSLGMSVMSFYWGYTLPAPSYDARDPLLFGHEVEGSVYWVVSFFSSDLTFIEWLASPERDWASAAQFDRVVVVEERNVDNLRSGMERMGAIVEDVNPTFQPVRTLRGCIEQDKGETEAAAQAYNAAGPYFQLGEEYLRTSQGFASVGDSNRAWREAVISKFMEPGDPDIHLWMSQQLEDAGHTSESQTERQIAERLRE